MTNNEIIRAWRDVDARDGSDVPENPAGIIELSDEDLGGVAGGTTPAWTILSAVTVISLATYELSCLTSNCRVSRCAGGTCRVLGFGCGGS